jgi:hypothetical protein
MFVCNNTGNTDFDCGDDDNGDGVDDCFGNDVGKSFYIKSSSQCPGANGSNWTCPASLKSGVTPPPTLASQLEKITAFDAATNFNGNNFLIDVGNGASAVLKEITNPDSCVTDLPNALVTQPGVESDIIKALNAIFGYYLPNVNASLGGTLENDPFYPNYKDYVIAPYPDPTVVAPTFYKPYMIEHKETGPPTSPTITETIPTGYTLARETYAQYNAANAAAVYQQKKISGGRSYRRVFPLPVANCPSTVNGASHLTIQGFACFFLPENIPGTGGDSYIIGELIKQEYCGLSTSDTFDLDSPGSGYEIVLYDYPLNNDE